VKHLRQSTPVVIPVGPFPDRTTALPLTALADQSANGRLIKNGVGGTVTVTSWAHDAQGTYLVGLSAAHTDTIGRLRVSLSDPATYLPTWEEFAVLSPAVFDVLYGTAAPARVGDAMAVVGAGLDGVLVETNLNLPDALSVILAATAGVGPGTVAGTVTYKNPAGTANRIVASVGNGNRTAVTLTPPP